MKSGWSFLGVHTFETGDIMEEIWKNIEGYDNRYQVSNLANARKNLKELGYPNGKAAAKLLSKPVAAYDKNGNEIIRFESTCEAGRHGYNEGHVASCCRGERKTHKNLIWKYI